MTEIIIIVSLALIFGILLIFLNHFLLGNNDKLESYLKRLPGYNCGACGYGSCMGMAEAMLKDKEAYQKCKPMRKEQKEELEDYLKNE